MTPWFEAYKELAILLDQFYSEHKENSGRVFYQVCATDKRFLPVNWWFSKFQQKLYGDMQSIDPIHIFASLNENRTKHKEKIERLNLFIELLEGQTIYEDIDFKGCPSPFSIKIMAVRKEEDQEEIWEVFHAVFTEGREALSQEMFSKFKRWYGIQITSFTIFLFWVDSEQFLPLDKNTRLFVLNGGIINHNPVSYADYLIILNGIDRQHYRELVTFAYEVITSNSIGEVKAKSIHHYFQNIAEAVFASNDFKVIAIRPGVDLVDGFKKVLTKDQLYCFSDAFDFTNLDFILKDETKDIDLYSIKDGNSKLKINISAIVGKNGSGKSSLAELLFLAINNLSRKIFGPESDLTYVEGLDLELYYFAGTIYKVNIKGDNVSWFKYRIEGDSKYVNPESIELSKSELENFFYTVGINYSHYALNSREVGEWINGLFIKNDAYQIPIVINPMRKEGNIDINNENDLIYQRLMANLLNPDEELRKITDNGRWAQYFTLNVNTEKLERISKKIQFPEDSEIQKILEKVYRFWMIPPIEEETKSDASKAADKYIYRKLATISMNYPKFGQPFIPDTGLFNEKTFHDYMVALEDDPSHITNKLRQAINFLKFPHLKHRWEGNAIEIEDMANRIQEVISENNTVVDLRIIELIPPAFFTVKLFLNDSSSFDRLSSGEKQKIYTVSSLVYHLSNLNSVEEYSGLAKYRYINILFDEAELYFHPDMQKSFIKYVLDYLKKVELDDISGLNFCFITHSPLLLSDIPQTNILFLKDSGLPLSPDEKIKTFAGNIHELLAESFFLGNGFIGQFAKEEIEGLIGQLTSDTYFKAEDQNRILSIIEMVGESFIRNELRKLFYAKFPDNDEKQKRIRELQEQIKALENA